MNLREWLPSRGNLLLTIIVVVGWLWVQQTSALVSNKTPLAATSISTIPYQGRLADATGAPITANVPMVFRLYATSSGGTALWQETWSNTNIVAIDNGLFNVLLGSLTPIPQSIVTANSSLWLGITVGADTEMASRVQLGSVVYAMQALTVVDSSISSAKIINGTIANVDIATNAINSGNIINGEVTRDDIAANAITSAKILDGEIISGDIANNTINGDKILDGSIVSGDIANNTINSDKIVNGTIANADIAANAINSGNIINGEIIGADLANATVNSQKITLTSNYAQSSGTFATTTGFQQIPGVSSTINPGINQYAYVYAMIDGVTTNDSGTIVGYISINGSPTGTPIAIGVHGQTQRSSAIGFARIPISAGNQTIALQVRTEVANGATIYNGAIMYFLAAQ